jgi:hypothetical protein
MKKVLLLALFLGFSAIAFAQETNCTDGIDNDNDGFIDCFDGNCATNAICKDSYTGNDKACQTTPPPSTAFQMTLKAESESIIASTHGRFVIGDMGSKTTGRDGIPEVVTAHHSTKKLFILDGVTLKEKFSATTLYKPERYDIAIANINNDGCAEAFVAEFQSINNAPDKHYISSYDCEANLLWRKQVYGRPFILNLADFDQDGKAELYYRNEIMDAATGDILVTGTGNWQEIDGGPVAVDILPTASCTECAGLELVMGGKIFAVDLNPRTVGGGALTLIKDFNTLPGIDPPGNNNANYYFPKAVSLGDNFVNSQTSIADYDLDGNLDVLMTGASRESTASSTTIFYWNVTKETFKLYKPLQANNSAWAHGAGRLNLADIDGNGQMNAAFVSGNRLFVLDENLNILNLPDATPWIKTISEVSSGYTSTTVFDFNNDGAAEIVYRDENNLYIFNGKTGVASPAIVCKSRTSNDYPLVADVDADGATEICVICAQDDSESSSASEEDGVIRTYKSALAPWVSARKVWNQHAYFNVNVNDDLTIPRVQQSHHLIFSTGVCGTGPNRALNSFLNQSAILDSKGCKTYPSADVAFEPSPLLINVTPPTCPDQNFTVSFTLKNIGDLALTGNLPVTFYSGDPRLVGAVKLNTVNVALADFGKGDLLPVPNITVTGTGTTFTLFAVLNDNGSSIPSPIILPNTGFVECNYTNNVVSASVVPNPFDLTTEVTNQFQCGATAAAPNGSAQVINWREQ